MVWKPNLYAGEPQEANGPRIKIDGMITFDGFVRDIFGMFDDFSNLAYFSDPREAFRIGRFIDQKRFPQHIIFANFQCLRCGLCCKNHDGVEVSTSLIEDWNLEGRYDILRYVDKDLGEIYPEKGSGCPFCRKATGKPYFNCKIQRYKERIVDCRPYLCSKSVPVAQINFRDVDELIVLFGIEKYYKLIEKDWGEEFDYSKSETKTHKKIE
jgi:hypothetical protein